MNIGIVGGGILGLSLAFYLQKRGHEVAVYERNPYLGGLASSFDYGDFVWDRFYHVILPQDSHLLELLTDLGLAGELRWQTTQTGFYAAGTFHPMSNTRQMLRFPLLGWPDKLRMGLATLYAVRLARTSDLYRITAAEWLTNVFGASNYTHFWRPLLRAKFGVYAETVAAVAIHAALQRLFRARSAMANRESMGYVHGGYDRILKAFEDRLENRGARVYLGTRIHRIGLAHEFAREPALVASAHHDGVETVNTGAGLPSGRERECAESAVCRIEFSTASGAPKAHWHDRVVFTAPTQFALPILSEGLRSIAVNGGCHDGTSTTYLGVACLNVVLRRSLTPYYVLNIADDRILLTGMIEMTGLIDRTEETSGLSLVYLPRYLDSQDPLLGADDQAVYDELFTKGLKKLFPDLAHDDVVSWHVQRAQHVQPLQLVTDTIPPPGNRLPDVRSPFVLANTTCLACPTLNNNEVIGLAKEVALAF